MHERIITMSDPTKRLTLAYEGLTEVPIDILRTRARVIEELDLSYNKITDLKFLTSFTELRSLILDHNGIQSHIQIPEMPDLHTLWLNHNRIKNLSTMISTLNKSCPNLQFLSMMNNEAAPSYFNGGTYPQYLDYRYFVISRFPKLQTLDDQAVTYEQREEAERIYGRKLEKKQKRKAKKTSSKEA